MLIFLNYRPSNQEILPEGLYFTTTKTYVLIWSGAVTLPFIFQLIEKNTAREIPDWFLWCLVLIILHQDASCACQGTQFWAFLSHNWHKYATGTHTSNTGQSKLSFILIPKITLHRQTNDQHSGHNKVFKKSCPNIFWNPKLLCPRKNKNRLFHLNASVQSSKALKTRIPTEAALATSLAANSTFPNTAQPLSTAHLFITPNIISVI